jgi:DNA-binding transcriptional MerR regulator
MLKIGEFARISQVSIKALRHYDAIGLLPPARIDHESGYRFYEMEQLGDLARILALKDCGFALDEIARLLQTHSALDIKEMLRQRIAAQEQLIAEEQARLHRITARLRQLERIDTPDAAFDVMLKQAEPLTLLGARRTVASTQEIGPFARVVWEQLEQHAVLPVGPLVHLYYDVDADNEQIDLFVGVPVMMLPLDDTDLLYERLPGGDLLACIIYRGDYGEIGAGYGMLGRWLAASNYQTIGPYREIYHRSPLHTTDPASYITEIQCPVKLIQDKSE